MARYKITIEYEGTGLVGWQKQPGEVSVQGAVEDAIYSFCQEEVNVQCSGRTDAGVHALGQVAHFDLENDHDPFKVKEAVNFHLREDKKLPHEGQVVILECEHADAEFNARFSAKQRHYVYHIINRRAHLTLDRHRAWCVFEDLDVEAMDEAAQILVGEHDFTSFRATACQANSPIKTIDEISVTKIGDLIEIKVSALSFLHHQIRNIAGSLKLVGTGKWRKADLQAALDAKDRTKAGPTAPAQGLYFAKVDY